MKLTAAIAVRRSCMRRGSSRRSQPLFSRRRPAVPEPVTLKMGGRLYGGWKQISIEIDLDAGASTFELGVTERWPGQPDRWLLEAGAAAEVAIGGETVVTGYIDELGSVLEDESRQVTIRGRSKCGDLVDCSA